MGGKTKITVQDGLMSVHWGICQQADALFGIKIKDKLAWPPAQVNGDDTVERSPDIDCAIASALDSLNDIGYIVTQRPLVDPQHPEIMTALRDEYIYQPKLFGGDTLAGGVAGLFTWLPGRSDQVIPNWMLKRFKMTDDKCPSFRGLATAFFSGGREAAMPKDRTGQSKGGARAYIGRLIASMNKGFKWGTNDPYVPAATLRVFRAPVAPPLRDFARWSLNPYNIDDKGQMFTRVIPVRRGQPRKRADGKGDLKAGGGFPAANPAAVLYELLSSARYDPSSTEDALDAESFLLCARLLSVERAGISFAWVDQDSVKSIVEEICKHINGGVFVHPRTGLYTMRLLRPDSAFKDLSLGKVETIRTPWNTGFVLSPSNADLDGEIERKSWADVVNWVSVKYTDDETSQVKSVNVQAADIIAAADGRVNDATLNYWMFRSEETAFAAGERDLAIASRPLMKAAWKLDRSAWALAPFDVITVNWPSEGLVGAKFRILTVDYGDHELGEIRIEAIEDVFSETPKKTALVPQPPMWTPDSKPYMDQPYLTPASAPILIRGGTTLDQVRALDADDESVMLHFVTSDGPLTGAEAHMAPGGYPNTVPKNGTVIDALPRAVLDEPLGVESQSTLNFYEMDFGHQEEDPEVGDLVVFVRRREDKPGLGLYWRTAVGGRLNATGLPPYEYAPEIYGNADRISHLDPHWHVGTAAMALDPDSASSATGAGLVPFFHEEVGRIKSVDPDTGAVVVQRGVFDTVPAPLPAGTWVYHIKSQDLVAMESASDGDGYQVVYRPQNSSGSAENPTERYDFLAYARQEMPAPPVNVRLTIGAETWGIGSKAVLDEPLPVVVRWSARNRLLDDAQPSAWGDAPRTPEPGQSHFVRVWRRVRRNDVGNTPAVLVAQFYGLGGGEFTVPASVFADSMTDPDWIPVHREQGGLYHKQETDIEYGAAFVIEVGSQRMVSGTSLEAGGSAILSAQSALILVDIGTTPSGWGMNYGNDYGGT